MIQNDDLLYLESQITESKYKELPHSPECSEGNNEDYLSNDAPNLTKDTIPGTTIKKENEENLGGFKLETNRKSRTKKYKVYPLEFKKKVIEEVRRYSI